MVYEVSTPEYVGVCLSPDGSLADSTQIAPSTFLNSGVYDTEVDMSSVKSSDEYDTSLPSQRGYTLFLTLSKSKAVTCQEATNYRAVKLLLTDKITAEGELQEYLFNNLKWLNSLFQPYSDMFLTGYKSVNIPCTKKYTCVSSVKDGQKVYTTQVDPATRTITYFTCTNAEKKYCVSSSGGI